MAGPPRIIAFGASDETAAQESAPPAQDAPDRPDEAPRDDGAERVEAEEEESAPSRSGHRWIAPVCAAAAVALWSGIFVWAHRTELAAGEPAEITGLVADWAVAVLLVGLAWLLFMRNSRREASRFGEAARMLAAESVQLETRLVTVNRELSLAREFLAAQSRDLEALGRMASERLSRNADRLQELIGENSSRIDTIGNVSEAALDNMEKLRGQLPVIASSAKDVANNIGNAGRTAHGQLEDMVNGFKRINEFGQACEAQVAKLRSLVLQTIAEFSRQGEQLEEIATARFAELNERGAQFRTQLETQEVQALAAIRNRAAALEEELEQSRHQLDKQEEECLVSLRARLSALRDEGGTLSRSLREREEEALESWRTRLERLTEDQESLFAAIREADRETAETAQRRLAEIAQEAESIQAEFAERARRQSEEIAVRRSEAEAGEQEAMARFSQTLASLDAEIARRSAEQERHSAQLASHAEAVAATLATYEERMGEIAAHAGGTEGRMAATLQRLADRITEARASLSGTGQQLDQLTDASVRLLELIQASAAHSREDLPVALLQSEERLSTLDERIGRVQDALDRAGRSGESLAGQIETSGDGLQSILTELERLQTLLEERSGAYEGTLGSLRDSLEALEQQSDRLSEKGQSELSAAIAKLGGEVQDAVASIEERGAAGISSLARRLGEESAEAIDKAMRTQAAEAAGRLEQAVAHAAGVTREATIQLRDQLAKVDELVGNLEQRVAQARERAEEQVDNDFARRAALITESLNSNAVDIAKALSTDVSDTAWAAYLRGDRGIFTRRAVSLIESSEAKAIQQIFERDPDFREHVSRYIHDFEAILRQVLSTRDGNALGVTLLSSDMGKLYVALAQAIERLRS